jgi:hypothetical protein
MVSRSETARQLLTPGEVMQLPPDDEIVMVAGVHPIRAKKARYYQDRRLSERIMPAPASVAATIRPDDWTGRQAAADPKQVARIVRDAEDAANAGLRRSPSCPSMSPSRPKRQHRQPRSSPSSMTNGTTRRGRRPCGAGCRARAASVARPRRRHRAVGGDHADRLNVYFRPRSPNRLTSWRSGDASRARRSWRRRSRPTCRRTAPTGWRRRSRAGSIACRGRQRLERNTGLTTEALACSSAFWRPAAARRGSGGGAGQRSQALRGFYRDAWPALRQRQEPAGRNTGGCLAAVNIA